MTNRAFLNYVAVDFQFKHKKEIFYTPMQIPNRILLTIFQPLRNKYKKLTIACEVLFKYI